MKTKTASKIITVALLRDLETQVHIKQEISYSRMVEILNEKATQQVTAATEGWRHDYKSVKSALSAQKRINAELKKRCEELEAQVEYWKKQDASDL